MQRYISAEPELAVVVELRNVSAVIEQLGIIGPSGPSQGVSTLDILSPAQQQLLDEQALPVQNRQLTSMADARNGQTSFVAQG